MKETRYTTTRRAQRRNAREQRVDAGIPSATLDWRCPVCKGWYSNYRGRNFIHLQYCKKKRKKQIARRESQRVQIPLPSPDPFTPHTTPDSTSVPQSPTFQEPLITGERGSEPPVVDEVLMGDENSGKSAAIF